MMPKKSRRTLRVGEACYYYRVSRSNNGHPRGTLSQVRLIIDMGGGKYCEGCFTSKLWTKEHEHEAIFGDDWNHKHLPRTAFRPKNAREFLEWYLAGQQGVFETGDWRLSLIVFRGPWPELTSLGVLA